MFTRFDASLEKRRPRINAGKEKYLPPINAALLLLSQPRKIETLELKTLL